MAGTAVVRQARTMSKHTLTITLDAEITDEAALVEAVESDTAPRRDHRRGSRSNGPSGWRTFTIAAGEHTITAVDPVPEDLGEALAAINDRSGTH